MSASGATRPPSGAPSASTRCAGPTRPTCNGDSTGGALALPGTITQPLEEWRQGRLVGTVEEVRAQRDEWGELGVETLIVGAGPVPFSLVDAEDVEVLAEALVAS